MWLNLSWSYRVPRPNKYKVISLDIPIARFKNHDGEVREMCVFCADILDILTQNFFSEKGKHIEEKAHVEDVKVSFSFWPSGYTFNNFVTFLQDSLRKCDKVLFNYKILQVTTFPDRPGYERVSSSLMVQREIYCASTIKRAWKYHHYPQKSRDNSHQSLSNQNGKQLW